MFLRPAIQVVVIFVVGQCYSDASFEGGLDLDAYFDALDNATDFQQRVVGGFSVGNEEYINYQISLQYIKNGVYRHFCGGSIVSPSRILTAAHCVVGQDAKNVSVLAGINDLDAKDGSRAQVTSIDVHPKYKPLNNDIAILSIHPPLELNGERIAKIDISAEMIGEKQQVQLSGWGSVHHFGSGFFSRHPKRLQLLNYETITNDECKATMNYVSDMQMCALATFGKGACKGDSGGPLVYRQDDRLTQVGVVSYGTTLCALNRPDVYTRVSKFYEWIKERID